MMGPASWTDDLTPIGTADWNAGRAAHLLERAGFGPTPDEAERLARLGPVEAVESLLEPSRDASDLPDFEPSGIDPPGPGPFPVSRPAATDLARAQGEALGIAVKPGGNRRMQPIVNAFFYWLRASRLETDRLAYWWANRMLRTPHPLAEKMALFWHGHFATSEEKVRDYRKMLAQLQLFRRLGTGNFRELLIGVAQDPAMLVFLDAGVNVKGAPNENFAREIMELFTMGVGPYSEADIREAARAFTGWNERDLRFVVDRDRHDDGEKTVLGRRGRFDGVDVIDILLEHPATPRFIAAKLYRFLVRQELTPAVGDRLAAVLRQHRWELRPLLRTIFLSRDFYSPPSHATRIKSPVELVVGTCRKLGLAEIPGVPDFNHVTGALGQRLFHPPTVAGWAQGRAWITPGLLIERGNFARDVLFPDIAFLPPDRYAPDATIRTVGERIARGEDITAATKPVGRGEGPEGMAMSNAMADRDEDFNTRYASFRGWQMAIERVKPLPRHTARIDLTAQVQAAGARTTTQVVDHFVGRFLPVPPPSDERGRLVAFLDEALGTPDVGRAATYMEDGLRMLVHLIMSTPEYQLQ